MSTKEDIDVHRYSVWGLVRNSHDTDGHGPKFIFNRKLFFVERMMILCLYVGSQIGKLSLILFNNSLSIITNICLISSYVFGVVKGQTKVTSDIS